MNKIDPRLTIGGNEVGFIYLIGFNTQQKIGKSTNVEATLAQARRFDSSARLLTCWPMVDPIDVEKRIHKGLEKYRQELEQFQLPDETQRWLCQLDDREFAAWETETACDVRTVGWEFPRVHHFEGLRCWACVYFPKSEYVAWAMTVLGAKPQYSMLEQMWLTDHKGFKSVWLGHPRRFCGPESYSSAAKVTLFEQDCRHMMTPCS